MADNVLRQLTTDQLVRLYGDTERQVYAAQTFLRAIDDELIRRGERELLDADGEDG